MPNYFVYSYVVASVIAIALALTGFSPHFFDYGLDDYGLFIGLLAYAWFLTLALMATLTVPVIRRALVARLGSRLILGQVLISSAYILWGVFMLVLLTRHGS
jgi:hypothetical protein